MYKSQADHASGRLSISEARESFADLVNRVAYGHERVLVARRGRTVAAIVPIEDVERLERLDRESAWHTGRDAGAAQERADQPQIGRGVDRSLIRASLERSPEDRIRAATVAARNLRAYLEAVRDPAG